MRDSFSTPPSASLTVGGALVMNLVLVAACVLLALNIINLPVQDFGNLGTPVQGFAALILMIPVGLALYASFKLTQRKNGGRFVSMALYFFCMVLTAAVLLHQWGVYRSFETVTDMIMANPNLVLGFVVAMFFFWLSGRSPATSIWRDRFSLMGFATMGITVLLILIAGNGFVGLGTLADSYRLPLTWVLTALVILLGFMAYRLLKLGEYFGQTPDEREAWQGWLMLSPNIIGFLVFFAGPLLLSFYLSFTDSTVGAVPNFKGLQNYTDILSFEWKTQADPEGSAQSVLSFGFTPLMEIQTNGPERIVIGSKDTTFWLSLRNTVLFCLLLMPLSVIPALFLAIILNSKLPGMKFFSCGVLFTLSGGGGGHGAHAPGREQPYGGCGGGSQDGRHPQEPAAACEARHFPDSCRKPVAVDDGRCARRRQHLCGEHGAILPS
ncbi:sugar ABC transporter permease [bacterium]|nr:sugar ABC transporter permease [bacterium]